MSPLRGLFLTSRRTIFSFARKSLWQLPPDQGPPIPQQELVDEEVCPNYKSAAFYQQSREKYWLGNSNYFSKLDGVHNQLYGSPETFQGIYPHP
jgi:hypothetical protein